MRGGRKGQKCPQTAPYSTLRAREHGAGIIGWGRGGVALRAVQRVLCEVSGPLCQSYAAGA